MVTTRPLWWWDNSWCLPFTPPGKPEEGIRRERKQPSESGWMEQKREQREQPWSKFAWKEKMRKTVRLNTKQYWGCWIGGSEGRHKIKGLDRQREESWETPHGVRWGFTQSRSFVAAHWETDAPNHPSFFILSCARLALQNWWGDSTDPIRPSSPRHFFFRELNLIIPAEAWSQINMTCALVPTLHMSRPGAESRGRLNSAAEVWFFHSFIHLPALTPWNLFHPGIKVELNCGETWLPLCLSLHIFVTLIVAAYEILKWISPFGTVAPCSLHSLPIDQTE